MPVVTLFGYGRPSGLPMAIASWPTCIFAESPIGAMVRSATGLTLTIARSVSVSRP